MERKQQRDKKQGFTKKSTFQKENPNRDHSKKNPKWNESIRLNKFIANAGICSRREADELIKSGEVSVNGEIDTCPTCYLMGDIIK